jgi:hypothetical protein
LVRFLLLFQVFDCPKDALPALAAGRYPHALEFVISGVSGKCTDSQTDSKVEDKARPTPINIRFQCTR